MKRKRNIAVAFMAVVGAALAIVLVRHLRHRHDQRMMSSCANHIIQLSFDVLQFVGEHDRFPSDTDTRTALAKMVTTNQLSDGWLMSRGSCCPESYVRDGSIGYVFVADGLPTKMVAEESVLVLFCPATSHQRSVQHCHAVTGPGLLKCLFSNKEMIDLLKREIGRAKAGQIPYSTNAVMKMEREVKAREVYLQKQPPNQRDSRLRPEATTTLK